tara:strand:+ start:7260 stop:7856 length:597 start_codon:yes stop_codon:yes gene_type:complete
MARHSRDDPFEPSRVVVARRRAIARTSSNDARDEVDDARATRVARDANARDMTIFVRSIRFDSIRFGTSRTDASRPTPESQTAVEAHERARSFFPRVARRARRISSRPLDRSRARLFASRAPIEFARVSRANHRRASSDGRRERTKTTLTIGRSVERVERVARGVGERRREARACAHHLSWTEIHSEANESPSVSITV